MVTQTEVDTTVFKSTKIATDGLGKTTGTGAVKVAQLSQAQALSGDVLPQVSSTGGTLTGVFHVVTTDGCGTVKAVLDPTATGQFSDGTALTTTQDVPGNNGNCPRSLSKKSLIRDLAERAGVITRRATNVNKDFPVAFSVPAGTTCSGTVNGLSNVCLVKMANTNGAGPFGGVVPIQIAGTNSTPAAAPAAAAAAAPAAAAAAPAKNAVRDHPREFIA